MGTLGSEAIHDSQVALFFGLILLFIAIALFSLTENPSTWIVIQNGTDYLYLGYLPHWKSL